MKIGLFEVVQIGLGQRWRVTNTLTGVAHVTYGTQAEVVEQLQLASSAWNRRYQKKTRGNGGWRQRKPGETSTRNP